MIARLDHKGGKMSTYSKSSTAVKHKVQDEMPELEVVEPGKSATIIPFPGAKGAPSPTNGSKKGEPRIDGKFLYHRGHKIPILHFQKSGYDKLLFLLLKEIDGR
jgi:hypothetical protein